MSLKHLLEAQRSGELNLLPGTPFNQCSPLHIEDGYAYVMFHGEEWFYREINSDLIVEALEILGYQKNDIEFPGDYKVLVKGGEGALFVGADWSDLFSQIVSETDIYVEF